MFRFLYKFSLHCGYDTFGALVQLPVPVEVEFQNCYFLSKLTFFFTITKIYI